MLYYSLHYIVDLSDSVDLGSERIIGVWLGYIWVIHSSTAPAGDDHGVGSYYLLLTSLFCSFFTDLYFLRRFPPSSASRLILFLHCSHVQLLGLALLREFHVFYRDTEWNVMICHNCPATYAMTLQQSYVYKIIIYVRF